MKRIILAIVSVTLVYTFWPQAENETVYEELEFDDEVVVKVAVPTQAPVVPVETQEAEAPAMVPQKRIQQFNTGGERRLPPGIVEFELLKGNWAVAHGDILLGKLQGEMDGSRGQFKPKKSVLWDSHKIPFAFSTSIEKSQIRMIEEAILEITSHTNLIFFRKGYIEPPPEDYIVFTSSEDRCASYLGKVGGPQPIFLTKDCGHKEVIHEVLHALGFVHEQSRKDRDRYVKINWENIQEGFENQFDIAPDAYLEIYRGFVFSFDYQSVMLYSSKHFAKEESLKTIESITNKEILPHQSGLSPVDIERINYIYGR